MLDSQDGPNVTTGVFIRGIQEDQIHRRYHRSRGWTSQEKQVTSKSWKGKEIDSPLQCPMDHSLADILILELLLSRTLKKIDLSCFMPLNLW